ncbi:MAG: hypothetical protein AAFX79_01505 [Planctomycetota bacterium]
MFCDHEGQQLGSDAPGGGTARTIYEAFANPAVRSPAWNSPPSEPPAKLENAAWQFAPSASTDYAHAPITAYAYDEAGNQEYVLHPDRTVTRSRYDGWGNVVLAQEGVTLDVSGGM